MSPAEVIKVTLHHRETEDGEVHHLEAYVDANGALVLEGHDLGRSVETVWGDSDYEYWRRVEKQHVTRVLLELIQDRFSSDVEFHQWLASKGIPDEFTSY